MNTIAGIQSKKNVEDLVTKLVGEGYEIRRTESTITAWQDGKKGMSAVSMNGRQWSVQVSQLIAEKFNIPLWKDQ